MSGSINNFGTWELVGGTISLTTNFCSDIPLDSFVVGKIKPAFLQKLRHRATKPFAYRIVLSFSPMVFLPVHSMYWPTWLQRLMLQISFLRWVRVRFRVTVYTQPAVGVYGDSTPVDCFRWDLRGIYQFYVIYMWLHFDIYIDVLCVPAYWSRDGTDTQRLDSFWVGTLQRWYQSTCWL